MILKLPSFLEGNFLVGATGLEPATSASQTQRATNCATPRLINYSTLFILSK